MAEIRAFKGHLYDYKKMNIKDLIAPPFDIISKKEQESLHNRHPKNISHLTLGEELPGDDEKHNQYTRAAEMLRRWCQDGTLIKDDKPALYLSSTSFAVEGKRFERHGILAMVRAEPFEKKVILPHERTFSRVKDERLQLLKACKADFDPIWSLYSDPEKIIPTLCTAQTEELLPVVDFLDDNGHRHKLWKITDKKTVRRLHDIFMEKRIYIADGHHRYETALNYRRMMQKNGKELPFDHPANFVMMYLTRMEDPAVVILPAHRMLKQIPVDIKNSFVKKAEPYFNIQSIAVSNKEKDTERFIHKVCSAGDRPTFGAYFSGSDRFHLLTLKPGVMQKHFSKEMEPAILDMDVTVLTRLIFMEIMGFDRERLDRHDLIGYDSVAKNALSYVFDHEFDAVFLLNPTRIEQVRHVADKGLIMPRKATYFYPKVITGLVIRIHQG